MAITVVATANQVPTATASPSVTFTSYTPQTNDVVVLFSNNTALGQTLTVPSGWVNLHPSGGNNQVASDAHEGWGLYHLVTSGEASGGTTTYTATNAWSGALSNNSVALVLRGVDPANVIDSSNTGFDNANAATPHILPSLTGTNLSSNSMVVGSIASDGSNTWTTPSGWTSRTTTSAAVLYTRDTLTTAGTDVAATNVTPSSGDEYVAYTVAFSALVFIAPKPLQLNQAVGRAAYV